MGLPKRSPDLNVLGYSLWKAVNDRMRAAEQGFPKGFRETKAAFVARLRRTALGLPEAEVTKAVQSMRRRTSFESSVAFSAIGKFLSTSAAANLS